VDPTQVLEQSAHLATTFNQLFSLVAMCSARMYAAMLVLPATTDQQLRGGIRNGVALSAGVFVALGQPFDLLSNLAPATLAILLLKEGFVGVLIGFSGSVVFWVAEGVGAMIDNQAGFNSAQLMNPTSGEQSTPMSNTIGHLATAAFFVLGGMQGLLAAIFESFRLWPITAAVPAWSNLLEDFVSRASSHYIETILKLAAPVMLVLLLIDLGFGLLSKTADKLEPNSLAQPVKGAVSFFMLSLLIAIFFDAAKPQLAMLDLVQEVQRWAEASPVR
jgi:type III secretion protein T